VGQHGKEFHMRKLAQSRTPLSLQSAPFTTALLFSVDPAEAKLSHIYNGSSYSENKSVEDFVISLPRGSKVLTESTIHLYHRKTRYSLIDAADKAGVEIWCMRSVFTSRHRDGDKDDYKDARAIWFAYEENPALFYRLRKYAGLGAKTQPGTPRYEINHRLVDLRRLDYPGYKDLHSATRGVVADVAVKFGFGYRKFRQLLGDNGCGYPNIARSNRNKHGAGKKPELRKEKMQAWSREAKATFKKFRAQSHSPLSLQSAPFTTALEEVFA
jgi:hypothetical protein